MNASVLFVSILGFAFTAQAEPDTVPDDQTITYWVGNALREDSRVWSANIDVASDNGVVRLSGVVESLMQQRLASTIASKIRGVTRVENKIEVLQSARSDLNIEQELTEVLEKSNRAHATDLTVVCRKGIVTLSGAVSSSGYRTEAHDLASEVQGVREIQNGIAIRPLQHRTDEEITAEIRKTIARDVYLVGLEIGIKTEDGHVKLTGSVGNEFQKRRAGSLAQQTANVLDVTNSIASNRLLERGERRTEVTPTNEELEDAVSTKLASDPKLNATKIKVKALSGNVDLTGEVATMRDSQIADIATRHVAGAVWVTNKISVNPKIRPDDDIRADVSQSLMMDAVVKNFGIRVQVVDGVVRLSGEVDSFLPRVRATERTGYVPGVRDIQNEIKVRWKSAISDLTLVENVTTRIRTNWETGVVVDRIKITVQNGNVVLTGDVDSWAQRREAGRMAFFTTGIQTVQNRITISGVSYPWNEKRGSEESEVPADWIREFRGDFFERPGVIRG